MTSCSWSLKLCAWFAPSLALLSDAGQPGRCRCTGVQLVRPLDANKAPQGMTLGIRIGVFAASQCGLCGDGSLDRMGSDRPDPSA